MPEKIETLENSSEKFETLESSSENFNLDKSTVEERDCLNCEEEIKLELAKNHPKELVEYQKNVEKYAALNSIVDSYKETEQNKNSERKNITEKVLYILIGQIVVFTLVFIAIFIFLAYKNEIKELITLSKWFLGATLTEIIGIVFVMVKYLFNDGEKLMSHLKDLVNGDEKKNT